MKNRLQNTWKGITDVRVTGGLVGVYESPEKILAGTGYPGPASTERFNYAFTGVGNCSIYIHLVLVWFFRLYTSVGSGLTEKSAIRGQKVVSAFNRKSAMHTHSLNSSHLEVDCLTGSGGLQKKSIISLSRCMCLLSRLPCCEKEYMS